MKRKGSGTGAYVDAALDQIQYSELDETTRQQARLAVCARATDVADARLLLEALGLIESSAVTRRWERR